MSTDSTLPRLFLKACTAVLLWVLALPASAQIERAARVSQVQGGAPAYVTSLTTPLVGNAPRVNSLTLSGAVTNLLIEALDSPGGMTHDRTTFGVGPGSHCAQSAGASGGVEFHNPTGTYSLGQPIAIACQTYTTRKCSRSVTFMGRTFTANKGYPPCSEDSDDVTPLTGEYTGNTPNQQDNSFEPTRTPSNGIFKLRIWGKVCHAATPNTTRCWNLKDPTPPPGFAFVANEAGYGATFWPNSNCGPRSWPTPELKAAGAPAYAKWCDVTVDVRR